MGRRVTAILVLLTSWLCLVAGDWYGVSISTDAVSGRNARFAFDYINTNDTLNCVYVDQIHSDAKIYDTSTAGGGHNDYRLYWYGFDHGEYVGVCDSSGAFYNNFVVDIDSLGSYFNFSVEYSPADSKPSLARDRFAFYFLGTFDNAFATDDTLANAMFTLSLNADGSQDLVVWFRPVSC